MIQTGQGKFNESFFLDVNGKWTLRTSGSSTTQSGAFDVPTNAIAIQKLRSGLVDTFTFYSDAAKLDLLKTITITYTDSTRINYTVDVF